MAMHFSFHIVNDEAQWNPGTVWYYNGDDNTIRGFHNTEELKYIQWAHQDTYGFPLKHYEWDAKVAPVYVRIFGTLEPDPYGKDAATMMKWLEKEIAVYIEAYGDPKWFLAKTVIPIRSDPTRIGDILGYTEINQLFEVEDAITACDYDWAIVTYNGKKAYIAMGDVTGASYGVRSRDKNDIQRFI